MSDPLQSPDNQETSSGLREAEPPHILSNPARDAFLALLDGDHKPNEALKAAAEEYKKGWRDGEAYHSQLPANNSDSGDSPNT